MRILDHLQQSVKSTFKFAFPPSVIHIEEETAKLTESFLNVLGCREQSESGKR